MPMGNPLWAYDQNIGIKMMKNKCSRYISPEYNVEICGNNLGFRDVDHSIAKPEGTFRILLLGDSFIAAREVELNKTFARLLDHKLNEISSKKIEVINMGIGGQGTGTQLLTLRHYGAKLQPDLVILALFLENDIANNYAPLEDRNYVPTYDLDKNGELIYVPFKPAPIISNPITNFISQNLFHNTFSFGGKIYRVIGRKIFWKDDLPSHFYTYLEDMPEDFKRAWEIEDKLVGELKKETEKINAKLFVFTLYSREQVTNFKFFKEAGYTSTVENFDREFPMRKITPMLKEYSIDYIHLYPIVVNMSLKKPEELFFHYDAHWSEKGHNLSTNLIFDALLKNDLIPVST